MPTLFDLLNLANESAENFRGIPVLPDPTCPVWEWMEPNVTCESVQGCIDDAFISWFLASPLGSINIINAGWLITLDVDPTVLNTLITSTWTSPMLTIWNSQINLAELLLNTSIYWSLSDAEQAHYHTPEHVVGNKETLFIDWTDGMTHQIVTWLWGTIWLPHTFITTPLWAPSQYDYNYWSTSWMETYNPRRYVLTWYTTDAVQADWSSITGIWRNCGRAVWAEPQCCMQALWIEWCKLVIEGWDDCEWRCQTIRENVNGSSSINVCHIFKQNIVLDWCELQYWLPGATINDPQILMTVDVCDTNNHHLLSYPWSSNYALEIFNFINNQLSSIRLEFMNDQTLAIVWNTLGISQPLWWADQTVDLSETNNHTLESFPGSVHELHTLEIHNSLWMVLGSINLEHIFNQTINLVWNILWISQPLWWADQTVDLSETNNHVLQSYPWSVYNMYTLELHNSNGVLLASVNLEHMFNQTLTLTGNTLGISQPSPDPDQTVDLSETNNHTLLSFAWVANDLYTLELHNSNWVLLSTANIEHMFNQTITYTWWNTICISQPLWASDQCVDLDAVNNHKLRLNDDCTLEMYSEIGWIVRSIVDMKPYYDTRACSEVCGCVMESVPDRLAAIPVPPTWRPAGWAAFLATTPTVNEMLARLTTRMHDTLNAIGITPVAMTKGYKSPCDCFSDAASPEVPACIDCAPICCDTEEDMYTNLPPRTPIVTKVYGRKNYAKRWIVNNFTVDQAFNWTLDTNGDVCAALNVWRTHMTDEFAPAWWGDSYGWNPVSMPASMMTNTAALNWSSAIKITKSGSYQLYLDWPILVNHMVHAFRLALVVKRWTDTIIYVDWKMWWDPGSGSWSVNNGYFKESKHYYVSSQKIIELLKDDIITFQVKIDSNVSRIFDELDPITLWQPWPTSNPQWSSETLRSSVANNQVFATEDDWVFQCADASWGADWAFVDNSGVYIEYGWPPTPAFDQNFNALSWWVAGDENYMVQTRLNGMVRTAKTTTAWNVYINCGYCDATFDLNMTYHTHSVIARMPAIPPQAPKYIHFSDANNARWNYPGRFSSALLNPDNLKTVAYSREWIDANGSIDFIGPSTWWDWWADYPTTPSGACAITTWYNNISEQSWFQFWVIQLADLWLSQVEVY